MNHENDLLPEEVRWRERVDGHELTCVLRGHLAHVTTTENFLRIIEDGLIKVDTSRNGIHPTGSKNNPSACQRLGAVSLFDFDVGDDKLYPPSMESGVYLKHWWNYLGKQEAAVIILLEDHVRSSVVSECFGPGQHIYGVEVCHEGDVPLSASTGFVFRRGNLTPEANCKVDLYGANEADQLSKKVKLWNDTKERRWLERILSKPE